MCHMWCMCCTLSFPQHGDMLSFVNCVNIYLVWAYVCSSAPPSRREGRGRERHDALVIAETLIWMFGKGGCLHTSVGCMYTMRVLVCT